MERFARTRRTATLVSLSLGCLALLPSAGCMHSLLATGIYLWEGGNMVPADCEHLEGQRVVVVCRPPSSGQYTHAGASRQLSRSVTALMRKNVKNVDMVDPREVDKWLDESDWEDYLELGHAVKADRLLVIDLANFELYKGKTLYQGNAEVTLTVYDVTTPDNEILYEKMLDNVMFPRNSAVPVQDKPERQFQREYVSILAEQIGVYFYKHDPNASFALDALANR